MDYTTFRTLWNEALTAAGLQLSPVRSKETIDLQTMARAYELYLSFGQDRAKPFYITARLSWQWDALHSARTATTEEDMLVELLGRDGYGLDTKRPWLRVDVTLNATLPMDSPLPLPAADVWRRWIGTVMHEMELLPTCDLPEVDWEAGEWPLFWQGTPEARLACRSDGRLYLAGVTLSTWQGIELARQWDNPDRPWDEEPEVQLGGKTLKR